MNDYRFKEHTPGISAADIVERVVKRGGGWRFHNVFFDIFILHFIF